jgi:hypothetical protein
MLMNTTTTTRRAGLVVLGLPSLADLATLPLTDGAHPPYPIAVLSTVVGVVSLALIVQALRAPSRPLSLLIGLRVLSAVTALPAFVVDGVPPAAQATAGTLVVLTAAGVLMAARGRTAVMAS